MPRPLPEWNRVQIEGLRHYYVNRFTGVLTCRMYGETVIRPRPDRMATISYREVDQATRRARMFLDGIGLLDLVVTTEPVEPADADA